MGMGSGGGRPRMYMLFTLLVAGKTSEKNVQSSGMNQRVRLIRFLRCVHIFVSLSFTFHSLMDVEEELVLYTAGLR